MKIHEVFSNEQFSDQGLRHRGGTGGRVPRYYKFLTLCLWVLHGKNGLQTAFVPPNHRVVTEPLFLIVSVFVTKLSDTHCKDKTQAIVADHSFVDLAL